MATSFRLWELSLAAREIGRQRDARCGTAAVARGYASRRTVLLRNSVRGAGALAVAVLMAQHVSLQHSF